MTTMAITVNDKRGDKRDASVKLEDVAKKDVERIHAVVFKEIKDYFAARMRKKDDGTYHPIQVTAPGHPQLEEIARYIVEGIAKSIDGRTWKAARCRDLIVGDVITLYSTVDGLPQDEEVTVLTSVANGGGSQFKVTARKQDGKYTSFDASGEWLFHAHRPEGDDE